MKIYTFNELKESKLIFDRKAPPFGIIITLIVLIFVVALLIFAGFAERTYVVKASGIVTSENKVNVMNSVGGTIKEVCVAEGQSVNQGDVVFAISTVEVDIQIEQIQSNIAFLEQNKRNYIILINFIDNYTLTEENSLINPFDNSKENEKRFFSNAEQFLTYASTKSDPDGIENSGDEISKTQKEIDNLKNQFTSQYYSTIDQYEYELVTSKAQEDSYANSKERYFVKSSNSGIMHFSVAITIGTVIQAGTLVGTISPANAESLYFETVVSATERCKIAVGNDVEIAITGVLQSEFGTLKGTITEIGSDSLQTESGEVYYKVKIKTESTVLKDKKGNTVALSNGMLAESRIKYDETTWLKWVIEQIGVKLR